MRSYRLCILCPIVAAALALAFAFFRPPPAEAQATPAAGKPVSFMEHVAPILKENCYACHDAKKRKGKLDMTTFERFMKGGERGEDITPGKPEESALLSFIKGEDEPRMPPKEIAGLLPKEKVTVIERWIKEGAKYDGPTPQADLVAELRKRWTPPMPPATYPRSSIVRALAFTPDNQHLVIGGHHELLVWDFNAGKLVKRLRTRAERANAMLFLPDGKSLVVAGGRPGQEGDVRIYNLDAPNPKKEGDVFLLDGVDEKAGVLVRELVQTDDEIFCLALSPDGKLLAAGGCDRLVRIWNLSQDYKLEQSIENHADWVLGVAFAADNKHLLTCSRDKTAKVWDLATKESVLTFPDHQNPVYAVAVKPDGKIGVSGGEDAQLRFWNAVGEGKQVRAVGGHGKAIWRVLYHPTKPIVATCSSDMTVRLWNPDNGQAIKTLSGHSDWVYALALSPNGELLASGTWNGEVRVWKVADGAVVKAFNASPGMQTAGK